MKPFFLLIFFILVFPGQAHSKAKLYTQTEYIMGTLFTIKIQTEEEPEAIFDQAFRIIRGYDLLLSDYRKDSERSRLLLQAPEQKTKMSPRFCRALLWSQYFSVLTDGAFDITMGPLMRLWGFRNAEYIRPNAQALEQTLKQTGFTKIDPTNCFFQRQSDAVEMDFGGIGKGVALDAAVSRLKQLGVQVAALDAGQSTHYFLGAPQGALQGWPVRFRTHNNSETLYLKNKAISSSGDGQQGIELDGKKYAHIINPKTGYPMRSKHSVTVIADDAMTADAMSTALMVLPQSSCLFYEQNLNIHVIYSSPGL